MHKGFLTVPKTARYFSIGELNDKTKHIWFVCHGYGHLADKFLSNFKTLQKNGHFIVAPEGLSRFYLEGFSGKVGASWMTKEDRLNDIKDYVTYLDQLYEEVLSGVNRDNVTINILGFSQGAATASRWIANANCHPDHFILWAGLFPPDLDFEVDSEIFQSLHVWLVYGKEDPFLKLKSVEEQANILKAHYIPYQTMTFDQGHEIPPKPLKKLAKRL